MKYLGKILITLSFFALLFLISSSSILAQDSIEVRTKECYWVDPWYVGADTLSSIGSTGPTWKDRYVQILKVWVINNQGKVDYISSMRVHFEGTDLADVEQVHIYRETDRGGDPWDTSYVKYPAGREDTLFCASGSFDLSGDVFFDFVDEYPTDSSRFELRPSGEANDSVLYYVVFLLTHGLDATHTDDLLDCMIPQDAVATQNGFHAPAANAGEGRTYDVLLDATPPNLTEGDIYIESWGDSAAIQLGLLGFPFMYTDSVVALTDNVTGAIAQSTDEILVFSDMRSLNSGTAYSGKRLTRITATDDFTYSDSIKHEDKQGYGVDIEAFQRLTGGGTPGSYIQYVTAWDEFGNSQDAWDLENPKPVDTIWPDTGLVEWILYYDGNGDGIAALGDTIKMRCDMRNQAPAGEPDEILNKDVYHTLFPRNGVYFADRYDFRGFDPSGTHYSYPFQFADDPGDEIWEIMFEVMSGDWDVDAGDADGYVWITAEDNANYWPDPPWTLINHMGPGNLRWWESPLFPFGVDNFAPVITDFTYDFQTDGDVTCLNVVNIGDVLLFVADLRGNLDTLSVVTIDLLTNGLGGPADAPLYDDGTHGDVVAGDGYYSLEWTIYEPAPMWTWDSEFDGAHSCTLTVMDNAGNTIIDVAYIGKVVDTEKPYPVYDLVGQALAGGQIELCWRDSTHPNDKAYYYIYSNGGTGGVGGIDTTTQYAHVAAPESCWTSDPLTHGQTYCFLIRNMDDACNMEHNYYNLICIAADAEPPTAEFVTPEDGDIYGPQMTPVQVIVRSPDLDIDYFKIYYRQKDIDPITPGDQPGPWLYGVGIDNDGQYGTGSWNPSPVLPDGVWEGVVCAEDEAGNQQTPSEAYALGQTVWIIWDSVPPVVFINSINDDYNPAGVQLINGVNNICVIGLDQDWTESMDVWLRLYDGSRYDTLFQGWQDAADVSPTSPYCFDFSLAGWQKDDATLGVWIFDQAGNKGMATLTRPVEDIYPVVARMSKPVNFERVMWTSALPVQGEFLAGSPVDEVVMVQFQERLHPDGDWMTYSTVYSHSGNYFNSTWDNTGYEHGNQVDLRALFFDDAIPANVETTAFITVTVDKETPAIELVIENAQLIGGIKYVAGDSLFLAARVLDYEDVDIKKVHFYRKKIEQPDMYYQFIGSGNMENNYTFFRSRKEISHWDTAYYHVKAIAWDAAWNEGPGVVDSFFYKGDRSAPQVAIYKIRTDTMEWINPSKWLRASEEGMHVYVQAYKPVTCWHLITTPGDSMQVDNIAYSWDGFNLGNYGLNDSMTFNPLEDGIITHWDLEDNGGSYRAKIHADLTDIFGNTTDDHSIYLYVLDVTGNEVVVINPDNQEYHSDQIRLRAASINDYNLRSVTYWYRPLGETEWIEIATVTDPGRSGWGYVWYTRNNVPDGWYEVAATSEDMAGNISEPGPFHRFFVGNAPPMCWMVSPSDSAFLGPNMDMRPGPGGNDFDTVIAAYARAANPGGCPIDYLEFAYKPITSDNWSWLRFEDDLTYFADSLYGRLWNIGNVGEGWYHVAAWAEDSCGNEVWSSDTLSVYMDLQSPFAEIIGVNDNHFPYNMDLGGAPYEDTLKARAWDPMGEQALRYTGFASGLDSLQFMIYKGSCGDYQTQDDIVFFGAVYEPNDSAQYEMIWNSEGADTGSYCWYCQAVDKVRNRMTSDGVPLRIEDHRQRVATIRAFHDGVVYASVNMPGVTGVTFQYFSLASSHWVNFGLAEPIDPSTWTWGDYNYPTSTMWFTYWNPTTLAEGYYLVRCLVHGPWEEDWYGPRKPGLAKPFEAVPGPVVRIHVDASGNVHPAETEDIDAISFRAVLETGTKGVVRVEAQRTPYLLAVYSHGAVEVERISLTKETGTDIQIGTFEIPWSYSEGGDVRFYASVVPDTTYIEMGGFDIAVVDQYEGTRGAVEFVDGSASIDIPGGAIRVNELNLVGYPTMMPPVVANECKKFTPVGNADGLIWEWYLFGYSADTNLDDYAKITLYYDETQVTVPESELQVARWDYDDYCWKFWGIESPVVDEENNSVTFWTDYVGTFAVVETPVAMWASVEVDPNCSDYSNSMPCFIAYIHSDYADIDEYSIRVKLGPVGGTMKTIYYDDEFADGYCSPFADWYYDYEWYCEGSAWDEISGELDICIMEEIKALAAGDYVIMVEAYDEVGNFASASYTFTVDVDVPVLTFLNGYVGKNPEFSFSINDTESGVSINSIYIDMYSVAKMQSEGGSWVESRRYLGTFTPAQIDIVGGVVDITTTLELVNNQAFDVVIYDGTYEDGGSPATQDQMRIYHPGHGPGDCVGNQTDPVYQRFAIDDKGPAVSLMTSKDARPVKLQVRDTESGVDWATFKFMEDGEEIEPDEIDQANGVVKYTPEAVGVGVEVKVSDNMGNATYYSFSTEAEELAITGAKNYPNPFENSTTVEFKLSRGGDVVVKIYDFGGELVKTLIPGDYKSAGLVHATWYGANDEGEDIANGIYLCHIKVNDGSHTATETIKIAKVSTD
jgi:hypothetical protein